VRLNSIKPAVGAKPSAKRVGRGIGSGLGKTCGRGHKGQRARAGGYHKVGFEGGQMPLQRRLPKRGFVSALSALTAQVRLSELNGVDAAVIDLAALKQANVVPATVLRAKVFLSGAVAKAVTLKGIAVTKGARAAIVQAGGKVEE
jgi:large subunit ribosomal protein L15